MAAYFEANAGYPCGHQHRTQTRASLCGRRLWGDQVKWDVREVDAAYRRRGYIVIETHYSLSVNLAGGDA